MKKTRTLLAFLALALAVATVLPSTWAYFTANARAGGGRTVQLQNDTKITETFGDWEKVITITTDPGTQPLYVRARAYSTYPLTYTGEGWQLNEADGWYYYDTPLASPVDTQGNAVSVPEWTQKDALPLTVKIHVEDLQPGEVPEDFDVVVVYETTPVVYLENGTRVPATETDWSPKLTLQNGGGAE